MQVEMDLRMQDNSELFGQVFEEEYSLIGPEGKSAYQVAVKNGFKGSEEEWLASLKGDPGNDYMLTPEDKAEIAEMAAELVDVPESGGDVDLTGYATEQYVKDYAQPKGNYLTEVPSGYATEEFVKNKIAEAELGGEEVDLSGYAQKSELPTKVSQLQNDSGYLTAVPDGYAKTEDIPKNASDIGAQPEGDYALRSEIPTVPVQSVNGKTGTVQLSASDVGARPNTWMPTAQDVGALPSTYTPPNQTAEQVGADPKGTAASAVSQHNTADDSHNDIRLELKAINDRLTAFFDSDNQTLDELSEIVAYITSNKSLIDSITTSKVSIADIINNLTSNVTNKPLSAAQGVVLKGLIDAVSNSLANYQPKGNYLTEETDPTVPAWAKQPTKPSYSKSEVGLGNVSNERQYSANNPPPYPVFSVNGKTGDVIIEADKFDPTAYDIPILYLTGDTTGMTKDVAVTLNWVYGENNGSCTLKWQGDSSLTYAKKNYTIKLDTAIDIGYGEQKKYCLKANYIDFSHARNIVSARIWGMMVASRSNVHETLAASPNYGAVNGFPVAIVLNGKFHGLYTFNIPKDGWMMNMGSGTQECILCADHSTATQFKGEATLVGETDFEIEYITDESNTAWAKTSVNRLINACINSNGGDLDTKVAQYLDWESAIDYYILVALLDGQDMTDKNYLLSTYDGTKWFFGAYDMDSTYGLKWDASGFSKAGYGDHTSFVNYANKHRVMELIKRFKTNALKARHAELRASVLSEDNIAREFERFACSIPSRLLEEDRNVWPMLPCTSVNNTFQILCWLNRRLAYVDKWIEELPEQEEVVGPSYTNVIETAGYTDGYRLSSSGSTSEQVGSTVTGFIELPYSDSTGLVGNPIIRVKGVTIGAQADVGFRCYFCTYTGNKTLGAYTHYDNFVSNATNAYSLTYDETTGVYTIDFSTVGTPTWVKYIRFNAKGNGADMIVTINEEIT